MSLARKEYLFSQWLEQQLSAEEQREFEQVCIADSEFAQRVETGSQWQMLAEDFASVPVPQWNKSQTWQPAEPAQKWWQWEGLPAMSFATSLAAIVLVVTGFQVEVSSGRVAIGFGSGPSEADVAALVEQRMTQFEQSNQSLMTQYIDALNIQQQQTNAQLTEYLLSSNREERREDFAQLIQFINEQRDDDQRFYARQLSQLQQDIYALEVDVD